MDSEMIILELNEKMDKAISTLEKRFTTVICILYGRKVDWDLFEGVWVVKILRFLLVFTRKCGRWMQ